MKSILTGVTFPFILVAAVASSTAEAQPGAQVNNWTAPPSWSGSSSGIRGIHTLGDVTSPIPFIGVTPCRIVDTRGATGPFGGPSLAAGVPRSFTLPSGPCAGIPAGSNAYSLNITVTNTLGPGFILLYPTGGAAPVVSTLNYVASQTIANAAVVPAGTGGAITAVAGVSGTDLIIDINGYYASTPATATNYFAVINSGLYAIYGETSNTDPFAAGVYGRATAGPALGIFGETLSTTDGTVAILGRATPSVGASRGVAGHTNSATDSSAGVSGVALATTGITFGVRGATNSATDNARGVFGVANATTGMTNGVRGVTNSVTDNAIGVFGRALGATGQTYGVYGQTLSSTDDTAGVLGEATSTTGQVFGVVGVSPSVGHGAGVVGALIDSTGAGTVIGFLGSAFGTAADLTGPPWAVYAVGNLGATGTKHFVEPHASDPARVIVYSSLEGREVGTYFRGTGRIVDHRAVIDVPEDFRMVTDQEGLTVQLTPVGAASAMYVESQNLNQIVVNGSRDVTFHYLVQGVRRAFKDLEPIRIGYEFVPRSPDDRMPAFLTEEARRRLIANGTYNADGTVNMNTAERLGWAKAWRESGANTRATALTRPLSKSATAEEK